MAKRILAYCGTRERYTTTLPLTLMSIANQTLLPDEIIIFDDNDEEKMIDMRQDQTLSYIFSIFDHKKIPWRVIYGKRKWPHYNHQMANRLGFDYCWRLDDDTFAESSVLESLMREMKKDVWAVGCSVITPPMVVQVWSWKIEELDRPNKQWSTIRKTEEVDHLHCSFLYRAWIVDYNLALSKRGFREETLFTYSLLQEWYKILITPWIVWHLQNKEGWIRSHSEENEKDENIFRWNLLYWKIFVLNSWIGDHIVFKKLLPEIRKKYKNFTIACCYPYVFDTERTISLAEAEILLWDTSNHNVYKFCVDNNWKDEMLLAFRKMYLWY